MNLLSAERSPYLLQHAGNPVAWMPWGEAAFARALAEDKPVFLSIGYSTCHWCHVMAHESFEDPVVADVLNEHFIPVKVDREERPDVDRVYMTYVQTVTGHGGWPLSAWLTPDLKPFYGGTYFAPVDQPGRPGFTAVLRAIAKAWREQRSQLVGEGERVVAILREQAAGGLAAGDTSQSEPPGGAVELEAAAREARRLCLRQYEESFDAANGGFGGAPKFPRPANLHFLLRGSAAESAASASEGGARVAGTKRSGGPADSAAHMAAVTLSKMAQGGIHDHVGGGFHRYSVDASWFVPHFEKMLYDQAQIALNCLDARVATGDERFGWLARDIFEYVRRDLTDPKGGFYSAEDADSLVENLGGRETEHGGRNVEGAFYVWTHAEVREALGAQGEAALVDFAPHFCAHFGIAEEGNVPPQLDPHGDLRGKNILAQRRPLLATARSAGLDLERANELLVVGLARLAGVRGQRPRPHLDDKIIAAWNGLMVSALVRGHVVLGAGDGGCLAAAILAVEFVRREMYDEARGVLFRSHRGDRGKVEGFAEDYAFLIQALLDLYEATFSIRWLRWAERLQQTMDRLFWDSELGGFFNSAAEDTRIVVRLKEGYDGAEPAPSSVAAMNLARLGAVFDTTTVAGLGGYRARARRTIEAFQGNWIANPHSLPQMMCALEPALAPPRHVVLAGDPESAEFQALVAIVNERLHRPYILLHAPRSGPVNLEDQPDADWLASRVQWISEMQPVSGRATAYVCEGFTCRAPVNDPVALRALLDS